MNDRSVVEQVLSGVIMAIIVVVMPIVWIVNLTKWFVVATAKETGSRLVKITGATIVIGIIGYVSQLYLY